MGAMPVRIILAMMAASAVVVPAQARKATAKSLTALADQVRASGEVAQLIESFTKAQHDFDQARLRALTSENYVEISPIGEVDPREKMLGFYDPAKKVDGPAMTVGGTDVRMIGSDAAIATTTISYSLPGPDGPRAVAMRAVFVAERGGGAWKLVSAQYTPVRAKN